MNIPVNFYRLFTALIFLTGCTASNKEKGGVHERSGKYLKEIADRHPSMGLVLVQVKDDSVFTYVTGKASKETGVPVSRNTLFEIGSVTKLFTAILAQKYVNRKLIGWNDNIAGSIPDVSFSINDSTTLKHLVSHTAGFPALPAFFTDSAPPVTNPYALVTEEKMVRYLSSFNDKQPPSFDNYNYSNFGMGLLGYMLEKRTGKNFEKLVSEEIAGPLGMNGTSITVTDSAALAIGYDKNGVATPYWGLGQIPGSGGLRSSAKDMAVFLKACLPGGALDSIVQPMLQPLGKSPEGAICYGWQKTAIEGTGDVYWHVGGTGGFRSYLGINPSKRTGVVVLTNQVIDGIDEIGKKFMIITSGNPR